MTLTLSGQNASKGVSLAHSHSVFLGSTQLTTENLSGTVTAISGISSINDSLKLKQITYNNQVVQAVGIGTEPLYPFDVAGNSRFQGNVVVGGSLTISTSLANLTIGSSSISIGGSGTPPTILHKKANYTALSYNQAAEVGLVLYSNNSVCFTAGAWSNTYLSALGQNTSSDRRMKTEVGTLELKVEDVASAPMVRYLWTARPELGIQVGSYAQEWQRILPEAVKTGHDGMLEMQYGVIALLSAIATARKVVDHERRILELERENETLKEQIRTLKAA